MSYPAVHAFALAVVLAGTAGCAAITGRAPAACDVLSVDEVARALSATGVSKADGSGFNSATGVDTCRWTADGKGRIELRVLRPNSSSGDALKMVFESSRVHATRPDASGRTLGRT